MTSRPTYTKEHYSVLLEGYQVKARAFNDVFFSSMFTLVQRNALQAVLTPMLLALANVKKVEQELYPEAFVGQGIGYTLPRRITNEELADLPSVWENSLVDTRRYYQSVLRAFEVDQETYQLHKTEGGLCQVCKGRYYIA